MTKVKLGYDSKHKQWLKNGKPVKDGYIAYDIKRNIKIRYNNDGTKDYLVKGKPYQSIYTYQQENKNRNHKIADYYNKNRYENSLSYVLTSMHPRVSKERLKQIIEHENDMVLEDANKLYPKPKALDLDDIELSDYFNRTIEVEKYRPQLARLAQWSIKHMPFIEQEKEYKFRDKTDSNAYIVNDNGIPIVTNKVFLKDIADAADKEGLSRSKAFAIAYGESNFGTNGNWVRNYNNNHNKLYDDIGLTKPASGAINNHAYIGGIRYPAIQEYAAATNQQPHKTATAPFIYIGEQYYKPDITKSRADKLIKDSDSLFNIRPSNAIADLFREYKKNPNSINPKNAEVDAKHRTYEQKTNDNVIKILNMAELQPFLERRRLESAGKKIK